MLVSGTAIVAGIYIACIQKMFAPIIPIYWITTGILMIAFLFVNKRNAEKCAHRSRPMGALIISVS